MKSTLFISFFHVPFGTKEIHQASLIKLRSAYFHCRIYELETTTAERSWLAIYWPIPKGNLPVEIQWKRCLWFKCWSKKVQHTTGVVIVVYIHKSWYIQYTCIIYIYIHIFLVESQAPWIFPYLKKTETFGKLQLLKQSLPSWRNPLWN